MSEADPSTPQEPRRSSAADDALRFLAMQQMMGWPVVLGPGVREPSVPMTERVSDGFRVEDPNAAPVPGRRYIRYKTNEDGSYEITFDPA